jgi:hypothetical protein
LTSFKNATAAAASSSAINSVSGHPSTYLQPFANPNSQLQQHQSGGQSFADMQYMQTGEDVDFLDPNFSSSILSRNLDLIRLLSQVVNPFLFILFSQFSAKIRCRFSTLSISSRPAIEQSKL